ncbi:hypothetical protein RHMOL_Rhmol10G0136600 [Rhododendron molle]|uniref:Uncharacterized protein n=1 Tax=Rhododendron molle TaxID=49168 RepID=A0ACC0M2X8_RHOML|nr:hypothetical protein RHMOL_Rhmol10G0136600 [Rhododendron molle]
MCGREEVQGGPSQVWTKRGAGVSYAQVLKGETSNPKEAEEQSITLHVNPKGNGWLFRSAVAFMNRIASMRTLKVSFSLETDMVAQFRALGGRSILITFQSQEVRDKLIKGPWMKRWFSEVKPWRNEPASLERFVWLSCQVLEESSFSNPDEVNPMQMVEERKSMQRIEGVEEEEKEDDDVLQSTKAVATKGKEVVGENLRLNNVAELAAMHGEDKTLDGVGGPKLNDADKHLMLDKVGDQVSYVSESKLRTIIPIGNQNELGVCSSQNPSINLLVDLNGAPCRKRRRQLANLIRIREELSKEPNMVEGSSSSSGDLIQTNSRIVEEDRATMAIGGELNVHFLANDDVV